MKSILPFLLYVSLRTSSVEAAAASFLPSDFRSWFWQSAIVVDKWLYIAGGETHSPQDEDGIIPINDKTFAIDLSNSWTTSDVTAKVSDRDVSDSGDDLKVSRRPELFYDKARKMVYSQGGVSYGRKGEIYPANDDLPELWGFTPSTDGSVDWKLQLSEKNVSTIPVNGDVFPLTSNVGCALVASSDTQHFSLGGFMSFPGPTKGTNQNMVMEDFVSYDYNTQKFVNQTRSTPHSLQGEGQFVPQYGEEGVLLFFGGKTPTDRGVDGLNLADLGTIQVYDIYSGTFYTQSATNAPQGRFNFCSVGASNAQGSSYEIFIYGGSTGASNPSSITAMSKVYILTLPAFTWIDAGAAASTWRTAHAYHPIGPPAIARHNQRQMLSLGGVQDDGDIDTFADPWTSGMKIFDLSALAWGDAYNASAAAYTRPAAVDNFYNANPAFPATWGDMALRPIFNTSVPATTSALPPTATASSPSPEPSKSSTATGAIAGGVVGGVGALAALALALWWFWWRKRSGAAGAPAAAELGAGGYHQPGVNELGGTARAELPVQTEAPPQGAHEMATGGYKEEPVQVAYEMPAGENGYRYG